MDEPTPLTLSFAPKFGAVHWDAGSSEFMKDDSGSLIIPDDNLRGRIVIFKPLLKGATEPRTTFEIGRHPNCWLKIGWGKDPYTRKLAEIRDYKGYPLMNYFPRISLTFQWMDANDWHWVGRSSWFVIPGGVFINKSGTRERSGANIDIFLNGRKVSASGNPEPLFVDGQKQTSIAIVNRDVHDKFDVPYAGKIIALDMALDRNTTGWPATIWKGPSWPELGPPKEAEPKPEALAQNIDIEEVIAKNKLTVVKPWYSLHLEAVWAWYTTKATWEQIIFLVLGSGGAALILWAWSR